MCGIEKIYSDSYEAGKTKTGGFKYESKIIFKGFYIGGHRSDHFFVRQCDNPVCAAAVFIKFDRFIGALRNGYGMRVYSGYFAVAHRRHCSGPGQ